MRVVALGATAVIATAALAACGSDDTGPRQADGSLSVNVLLPYPQGLSWTGLLVGQGAGFFDEENLEVTTDAADGSGFVVQQVLSGNVDYGLAAASEAVVAFEKDPSLRAVFCNKHKNIFRIVTPQGSGIASVADLKGKTLGITERGGGEDTIAKAALANAGLGEDEVKILPIGSAGPQSKEALNAGKVDAYAASFPNVISLTIGGLEFDDITPAEFEDMPGDCLLVKESTLEKEGAREALVGLARAWSRGMQYAIDDPAAALELACSAVAEACADKAYATAYWEYNRDLLIPVPGLKPGEINADGWLVVAKILSDTGVTKSLVDVESHISGGVVGEIQDEWASYDTADVVPTS